MQLSSLFSAAYAAPVPERPAPPSPGAEQGTQASPAGLYLGATLRSPPPAPWGAPAAHGGCRGQVRHPRPGEVPAARPAHSPAAAPALRPGPTASSPGGRALARRLPRAPGNGRPRPLSRSSQPAEGPAAAGRAGRARAFARPGRAPTSLRAFSSALGTAAGLRASSSRLLACRRGARLRRFTFFQAAEWKPWLVRMVVKSPWKPRLQLAPRRKSDPYPLRSRRPALPPEAVAVPRAGSPAGRGPGSSDGRTDGRTDPGHGARTAADLSTFILFSLAFQDYHNTCCPYRCAWLKR